MNFFALIYFWDYIRLEMKEFEEYLERRGAKYFVTFTVLSYVVGTIIFNIYLNSINIAEFNLLKLRYMFVGIMFALITSVFPIVYFLLKKILGKKTVRSEDEEPKKKKTYMELVLFVLFVPWIIFYSTNIFPEIPAGFGGAKPEVVRLVGNPDTIKELNELIAFETGVDVETLPFQYATEKSTLAIGANVKILDRNSDRYVLILTKDLYLSSTSNVAKELLESGEIKSFDSASDDFFKAKPIYFSSENIRGTTTTLFEPPKITTSDDLKVVAQVVADNPEKAKAVQDVIAKDLPGSANRIIEAVKKKAEETKIENPASDNTVDENDIDEIIEDSIDPAFLSFRADMFNLAGNLYEKERAGTAGVNARKNFVETITERFKSDFPVEWNLFSGEENYLILGQSETDFPRTIQGVFRGADSAKIIIERLNALEVKKVDDFTPVIAEAKVLFDSSYQENSEYNRKFMSEVLVRHFNQKARKYTASWSDPKYLYSGVHDENYFENLKNFFDQVDSWESVKITLTSYQEAFDSKNTPSDNAEVQDQGSESGQEEAETNTDPTTDGETDKTEGSGEQTTENEGGSSGNGQ